MAVSPIGYIEVRDRSSEFKRISSPIDLLALVGCSLGRLDRGQRLLD